MIYHLKAGEKFPPTQLADEHGLLCVGGQPTPSRLLEAYSQGIFPWYNQDDPPLWWTPNPRCVARPSEVSCPKGLRNYAKTHQWRITCDEAFVEVVQACAAPRGLEQGSHTWITPQIMKGYHQLHLQNWAHSIEVWQAEKLIGGLYGVVMGKVFFGESMFTRSSNASKAAFFGLCGFLRDMQFELIDGQVASDHLQSLGFTLWKRNAFETALKQAIGAPDKAVEFAKNFNAMAHAIGLTGMLSLCSAPGK